MGVQIDFGGQCFKDRERSKFAAVIRGNGAEHLREMLTILILQLLRDGGADEKLDSRRRQLYVHKRARRARFKGV